MKSEPNQSGASVGFTLIEVMVVLAIMGAMVAVIGFNLSNDTDRLARLEAKRFLAVVTEVRDEAIINGEDFLLLLDDEAMTYHFEGIYQGRDTARDDGLLAVRTAQQGVELRWEVLDDFQEQSDERENKPKVLITALGEITPFSASFSGDEKQYRVFVNDENQLQQESKDEF